MKKIREINGRKIAFIQEQDINALKASKDFVKPEIFKEPEIQDMICDCDGYYRISNPANVEYIESLGFIPDIDFLSRLSDEELERLISQISEEKATLSEIIIKLCEYKEKLTAKERKVIKNANYLESKCKSSIEHNVLNASLKTIAFESMKVALLAQLRNYTYSLIRFSSQRKSNQKKMLH